MISAIAQLGMKTIVITHKSRLRDQWKSEFIDKSNIAENRLIPIESSEDIKSIMRGDKEGDVYLVNHQTLSSFARAESWQKLHLFFQKAQIGIKVVDEAHRFFENSLMTVASFIFIFLCLTLKLS